MVLNRSVAGPPCGLIFKIQAERSGGEKYFVRMYSGEIKSGTVVYNVTKRVRERIHRLLRIHANHSERISSLSAGDIGVIGGFKQAQTGDSIGSEEVPLLLEHMRFPQPVIAATIEPQTFSERERLKNILQMLSKEDPTFTWTEDAESGQLIISGMGELHLDVLVTRIINDYGITARIGTPQVSYRETITSEVEHTERFQRMIGGKEHRAELQMTVTPRATGKGNEIVSQIDDLVPSAMLDVIRRGVETAISSGVGFGYPVVDVAVVLRRVRHDEQASSELAFEAAASQGFDAACGKAGPVLLEPIMRLNIFCPKEYTGEVIGGIHQRGGIVQGIDSRPSAEQIYAEAPLRTMFGYATALRSATQGRGTFTMEFRHFAPSMNNR